MSKGNDRDAVHAAVKLGDVEALKRALAAARDPVAAANAETPKGYTPLDRAIQYGHTVLLPVLVEAGAVLHNKKSYGKSALALVAETGNVEMLRALLVLEAAKKWTPRERLEALEAAADQNRPDIMDALPGVTDPKLKGMAARAAYLGHAGSVRWFVTHGVSMTEPELMGGETTPLLHQAAAGGCAAVVAVLLELGADPNLRDARGRTPLMHAARQEPNIVVHHVSNWARLAAAHARGGVIYQAAERESPAVGRPDTALGFLLAAGADATLRDVDGLDALAILMHEYEDAFATAGESEGPVDLTSLASDTVAMIPKDAALAMWAEEGDDAASEKVAAAEKVALDRFVGAFAMALRDAGAVGRSEADLAVINAIKSKDAAALKRALDAGGDARVAILIANNHRSTTPLAYAAGLGDLESCRLLLDAGSDPNGEVGDEPPLVSAARADRREVVALLLARGADPAKTSRSDPTYNALVAARMARRKDIVELLLAAGATEPTPDEPFTPGATMDFTVTELLVQADARVVAEAVATSIHGEAVHGVNGKTILAASRRGYLIVQMKGSAWTSVLPHVGVERIPDDAWRELSRDASATAAARAILLCYEKVSGQHVYWMYERGEEIEHFEENLGEPELGATGVWKSNRGRKRPRQMKRGDQVLQKLAEEEHFCVFVSNPGGTPGAAFEVVFTGDRRALADVAYVRG
jgi:ankyrin repeat protein